MYRILAAGLCALAAARLAGAWLDADENTSECCPTCEAWETDCDFTGWVLTSFPTQAECVNNCYGSCLYDPSAQWDCVSEPCQPDPCGFTGSEDVGSPRLGACVPATNYSSAPDKTMGIPGSYAAIVNQTQTMMSQGGFAPIITGWSNGAEDMLVQTCGSSVFWVETNPNDDTNYYLRAKNASGLVEYTFLLGSDFDYLFFGASEEVVVNGVWDSDAGGGRWFAYVAGQLNSTISNVLIRQEAFNIEFNPIVRGTTAFVMTSYNGVEPPQYNLYYWDVYQPSTVNEVNITFGGCMYSGQSADTINPGDFDIFCTDDHNVATCTFYFGARSGESGDAYLCNMPVTTGVVKPIIGKSTYIPGATVAFFKSGVVVSAGSFATRVTPGDLMVYLYKSGGYHWVNDELQHTVNYCYANAFVNIHQPGGSSSAHYWVLVDDVLVYRVTPGFGTAAFFAYNLTSQDVSPVALPWGLPNTRCNYYTYGGNCPQCNDETIGGFTLVYLLSNGSLVMEESINTNSLMSYGLAQFDSPATMASQRCPGCSPTGGTCAGGKCYCVPGCTGAMCTEGAAFCSQATLSCSTPSSNTGSGGAASWFI